jgi:hypothetical protein
MFARTLYIKEQQGFVTDVTCNLILVATCLVNQQNKLLHVCFFNSKNSYVLILGKYHLFYSL